MKENQKEESKKFLIAGTLILLGVLFRTVWHFGDNVEFVTAASLLAAVYLGVRWSILVPFLIMCISDLYIGNTRIFLFTWSAYMMIGVAGYARSKIKDKRSKIKDKNSSLRFLFKVTGWGMGASVFFFLWTNFGVWFLDSWGMYPKTFEGLMQSYMFGLPFLKANMIGNSILVPSSFIIAYSLGSIFSSNRREMSEEKKIYI